MYSDDLSQVPTDLNMVNTPNITVTLKRPSVHRLRQPRPQKRPRPTPPSHQQHVASKQKQQQQQQHRRSPRKRLPVGQQEQEQPPKRAKTSRPRPEANTVPFAVASPSLTISPSADISLKPAKGELSEEAKECLVWLEIIQVHKLRTIFDSIKDIITNVNLKFFPEGDPDHGLMMFSFDTSGTALVKLTCPALDISDAGVFHCKRAVRAGINIAKFHRLLKTMKNHDSLVLFMRDDNSGYLYLRANRAGSMGGSQPQEFKHMLLALNDDAIGDCKSQYNTVRHIPAETFQGLVRDLIQSVDPPSVGVSCREGLLALHGIGEFAHARIPYDDINDAITMGHGGAPIPYVGSATTGQTISFGESGAPLQLQGIDEVPRASAGSLA